MWQTEQIKEIWEAEREVYGARRVHAELRLGRGINVSCKRVERLMREAQISGLIRKRRTLLGIGSTALSIWDIAKWPVLVLIVAFMFAVLYYSAPNVKQPGLKAVMPGGLLAVGLWIVASGLFAFYVANFGSYNKTYGALGGVIVFLVWQHIKAGHAPDQEPYLPARSQP